MTMARYMDGGWRKNGYQKPDRWRTMLYSGKSFIDYHLKQLERQPMCLIRL